MNDEDVQLCALDGCYNDVGGFDIGLCEYHVQMAAWMYNDHVDETVRSMKRTEREDKLGGLYFVKVGDRIKVGWAFDPRRRLRQYPPGSEVLAIKWLVKIAEERDMHVRLTQWRDAGREWYRDCPEVRAVAEEIRQEHGVPKPIRWGSGQSRPRTTPGVSRRAVTVQ